MVRARLPALRTLSYQARIVAMREQRNAVVAGRASGFFEMMTEENESLGKRSYFLPFLLGFFFGAFFLAAML
jgi:hypothetical protein